MFEELIDEEQLKEELKVIDTDSIALAKLYVRFRTFENQKLPEGLSELHSLLEELNDDININNSFLRHKIKRLVSLNDRGKMVEFVLENAVKELKKKKEKPKDSTLDKIEELKRGLKGGNSKEDSKEKV